MIEPRFFELLNLVKESIRVSDESLVDSLISVLVFRLAVLGKVLDSILLEIITCVTGDLLVVVAAVLVPLVELCEDSAKPLTGVSEEDWLELIDVVLALEVEVEAADDCKPHVVGVERPFDIQKLPEECFL